jgi:hypothetical protein
MMLQVHLRVTGNHRPICWSGSIGQGKYYLVLKITGEGAG